MDNQLDCDLINQVDPLDEINVIDKQNLITTYVMLVYNTLYSLGDSIAGRLIRLLMDDRSIRQTTFIQNGGERLKISTIPENHVEYLTYESDGPTIWDCSLFDDSVSIIMVLGISTNSCSVRQTIVSECTPVNDEGEEMIQEVVEETNSRLAALRGDRPDVPADVFLESQLNGQTNDGGDGDGDGGGNDDDSDVVYYENPPLKRFSAESELYNCFERDSTSGVEAESTLIFGFRLASSPYPEPDDFKCDLTIKTKTYVHHKSGRCILTSSTRIEETLLNLTSQGYEASKKVTGETPIISFAQTMDRQFAILMADAIATNYTAVIQIIGIALILYFGTS